LNYLLGNVENNIGLVFTMSCSYILRNMFSGKYTSYTSPNITYSSWRKSG